MQNIAVSIEWKGERIDLAEAGRLAADLFGRDQESRAELNRRRARLGALLIEVKKTVPHGEYTRWLQRHGVHRSTAKAAVALAREFAGDDGELDTGRMERARDEAVAQGRVPADHPLASKPAEDWSWNDARAVVGSRSIANAEPNKIGNGHRGDHLNTATGDADPFAVGGWGDDDFATPRPLRLSGAETADRSGVAAAVAGSQLEILDLVRELARELAEELAELADEPDMDTDEMNEIAGRLRRLTEMIEAARAA